MNIFVLDTNIQKCAEYHANKHVIKMILETTQLLNNALAHHDPNYTLIYLITHQNHPCSVWARTSRDNFDWLLDLGLALSWEYTYRYSKIHKCQAIIEQMRNCSSRLKIPQIGQTSFAQCMPSEYKVEDAIQSYRNYYIGAKRHLAQWKNRPIPKWWA